MSNFFLRSYLPLVLFGFGLVSFVASISSVNPAYVTIGFRAYVMGGALILIAGTARPIKKINKYMVMISIFLVMYGVRLVIDSSNFDFGMTTEVLYLKFVAFVLVPFFTLSLVKLKPDIEWPSFYILFLIILSSFISLLSSPDTTQLSGNDILNPTTLGFYAGYLIITIVYILNSQRVSSSVRLFLIFSLSLSFIVLGASLSRASMIGLLGVGLLEFFSMRRRPVFWPLIFLVVFVISSYFFVSAFDSLSIARLTIDTGASGGDGEVRVFLWLAAIENIIQNPILGSHVTTSFGYVHSVYLEAIMATGLVGAILLITPLWVFGARFVRSRKAGFNVPIIHYYCIFTILTVMFSGTVYTSSFLFALLPVVFNYGQRLDAKSL